jgi:hypothetical protein
MPHYQLPAANVPWYLDAIAACLEKTLKTERYDQTSRYYKGSFLNVFHQPTPSLLVKAMVALSKLLGKACQPDLRKSAHRDPQHEADFSSHLLQGNLFEGGRFGLTDTYHILAIQEDCQKDT